MSAHAVTTCPEHTTDFYGMDLLVGSFRLCQTTCYTCHALGDTYSHGEHYVHKCLKCIAADDPPYEYCEKCSKLTGSAVFINEYLDIPVDKQLNIKSSRNKKH